MFGLAGTAEVGGGGSPCRRHHVPAEAPAADRIKGRQARGELAGVVVAGGGRPRSAAKGAGFGGDAAQDAGFEAVAGPVFKVFFDDRAVGEEHGVELGRLCLLRDAHVVLQRVGGEGMVLRYAPRAAEHAGVEDVHVDVEVAAGPGSVAGHLLFQVFTKWLRDWASKMIPCTYWRGLSPATGSTRG